MNTAILIYIGGVYQLLWALSHFLFPKQLDWENSLAVLDDFMKESIRKRSIEHTATLAGQGGGWFIITSPGESVADPIEAGQAPT